MVIAALLVAIYKWIMSSDDNEELQKVEETETATSENVKPEETTEEVKQNGEDTVENHNK